MLSFYLIDRNRFRWNPRKRFINFNSNSIECRKKRREATKNFSGLGNTFNYSWSPKMHTGGGGMKQHPSRQIFEKLVNKNAIKPKKGGPPCNFS